MGIEKRAGEKIQTYISSGAHTVLNTLRLNMFWNRYSSREIKPL
jgi:hypothetical protein